MKQYLLLIGTAVLLALSSSQAKKLDIDLIWDPDEATWKLESDYQKLAQVFNARMEELNEPETVDGAMNVIASLHENWPKADGFMGKLGVSEKKLDEAMKLLEELGEAYNKCDYHSFKILRSNLFLAIGRQPAPLDPAKSKLHSIIQQVWQQHAATCRSEHLDWYKSQHDIVIIDYLRKVLNKETIETIFGTLDLKTILSMDPKEVSERLPKSGEFWVRRTYEVSKGTIGEQHFKVKGDRIKLTSKAWEGGRDWPHEAVQSRIVQKCWWILWRADVFRPVMFDFVLDDEKLAQITQGDEGFEHALMALKACPALMENRDLLIKAVKKYV